MKLEIKDLEEMLKSGGAALPEERKDFRKLVAIYHCMAAKDEREERCTSFSPGPSGRCTFQDFSQKTIVCRR